MSNTLKDLNEAAKQEVKQFLLQAIEALDSGDVISCRFTIDTHPERIDLGSRYDFFTSRFRTLRIELDYVAKEKT